jgi:hypothetical protein
MLRVFEESKERGLEASNSIPYTNCIGDIEIILKMLKPGSINITPILYNCLKIIPMLTLFATQLELIDYYGSSGNWLKMKEVLESFEKFCRPSSKLVAMIIRYYLKAKMYTELVRC